MTSIDLPLRMKLAARLFPALIAVAALTTGCGRSDLDFLRLGPGDPNLPEEPPTAACGDGTIDPGETCDGSDLGGARCESLGFASGVVRCDPVSCTLDTGSCRLPEPGPEPTCGNGFVDPGEQCDGFDVGRASCESLGLGFGELACRPGSCTFDPRFCERNVPGCGNDVVDPGEQCDGRKLRGATCESEGLEPGVIYCDPDTCQLNLDDCGVAEFACGNGVLEDWEECDGDDFGGLTCESKGLSGGELRCRDCQIDFDLCAQCGDGRVDDSEECEVDWLRGQNCYSLGFAGGALACGDTCDFDVSGCSWCGNGIVEPGESCDGNNLQGQSCRSLSLGTGKLACSPSACKLVTSGCSQGPRCGNSVIELGEDCDRNSWADLTCRDLGFDDGTLRCNSRTCRNNVSGCVRKSTNDCVDTCTEFQCSTARRACEDTEGCEEVLACFDDCHEDPTFGCASACAADLDATGVAVIYSDCVSDCALSCSGG